VSRRPAFWSNRDPLWVWQWGCREDLLWMVSRGSRYSRGTSGKGNSLGFASTGASEERSESSLPVAPLADPSKVLATLAATLAVSTATRSGRTHTKRILQVGSSHSTRAIRIRQRFATVHHSSANGRKASPDTITLSNSRPTSSGRTYSTALFVREFWELRRHSGPIETLP
jgi:hypothetical protein